MTYYVPCDSIPRDAFQLLCKCGKHAKRVDCTSEEMSEFNCGRSYECCARAFQCECGLRVAGSCDAPESF